MLKQIFKKLSGDQHQQLMTAFEQEFSSFIELPNNMFLGVNLSPLPLLEVTCREGVWSYGRIIK